MIKKKLLLKDVACVPAAVTDKRLSLEESILGKKSQ